jgi:hypothetical protein
MKGHEMDVRVSKFLAENMYGKGQSLVDLGVDWSVMLKCTRQQYCGGFWTGLFWFRVQASGGLCLIW